MIGAHLIVLALLGQPAVPSRDAAALVEKLGSATYTEREASSKSLETLGSKVSPALRSASKSKDPEVRKRARALINKIDGNLLIQESSVRLDFKDATLDEIFKSLSKQVGFEIGPVQPSPRFEARRITLSEPQPVPFWKAIDQLCEVGQLTCEYQGMPLRGQGGSQPRLVLSDQPAPSTQPGFNHGPFRLNVVSLLYQNQLSFSAPARVRAQLRAGARGIDGAARKVASPLPAGAPGPGGEKNAGLAPVRIVQFRVQLQIVPEPRMAINQVGPLRLVEAVDELGQSLLTTARDDERAAGPMVMTGASMPGGTAANLTAQLHRPEAPGKLIKTLRGTVEVSVSAPRPNPLVIPLAGASGKTFRNDDRSVVVNAIDADPMRRQQIIELTIDDMDELLPAESVNGPGFAGRPAMMGQGFIRSFGGDPSRWPIQVLTSTGQSAFFQPSIGQASGRVTLRLNQMPQMGEVKEIRISSIVRATAMVSFEFHDLPMP
jgi:hypothetical protein